MPFHLGWTHSLFKMDKQQIAHGTLLSVTNNMDGRGVGGRMDRPPSPFPVHLKPSQHCLLMGYAAASSFQSRPTLCDCGLPARLLCPRNSLGKSTGVGCHDLLQGIFPTQGSNPCLLHCRQTLYH